MFMCQLSIPIFNKYLFNVISDYLLTKQSAFSKNYYLTPISSINQTWNDILDSIYINNTFTNDTITDDQYIFNIIISNTTHLSGPALMALPYSQNIKRITLNIDCLDNHMCDVFIVNDTLFEIQQDSYSGTHITLTMSSLV